MKKIWSDKAREDYLYWQTQDKKTLKRINGEFIDILSCNGHYENSQKKFPIRTDWEFFAKAIFVRIKLLRRVPEPS